MSEGAINGQITTAEIKERLCSALCSGLHIEAMPFGAGFSVAMKNIDVWRDVVHAYLVRLEGDQWEIRDPGFLIPDLIASGVDLSSRTRAEALHRIVSSMRAMLDKSDHELVAGPMALDEAVDNAPRFLIGLSRIADMAMMNAERTASTFREDVIAMIQQRRPQDVEIRLDAPVSPEVQDIPADVVLQKRGRVPFGLFLAPNERGLWMATVAATELRRLPDQQHRPRIGAVLESQKAAPEKIKTMAQNRLDALNIYEGDRDAAIDAVLRKVDEFPEAA